MLVTAMIINNNTDATHFVCPDCENGGWYFPVESIWAIVYWVLGASCTAYGLMTWGNKYADASLVMSYTVLQPICSAGLSEILILTGAVDECSATRDENCLHGMKTADLGVIGIAIGLFFVIRSNLTEKKLHDDVE